MLKEKGKDKMRWRLDCCRNSYDINKVVWMLQKLNLSFHKILVVFFLLPGNFIFYLNKLRSKVVLH